MNAIVAIFLICAYFSDTDDSKYTSIYDRILKDVPLRYYGRFR